MQEKKGDKYEALTPKGGHELLVVVSWYEGFLACNDEGSPNQVTFMLISKKMLITSREDAKILKIIFSIRQLTLRFVSNPSLEPFSLGDLKVWYEHFHNKEKEVKLDADRAKVVVNSLKDVVSASACLTQGCQV